jgi:hypothetical protein
MFMVQELTELLRKKESASLDDFWTGRGSGAKTCSNSSYEGIPGSARKKPSIYETKVIDRLITHYKNPIKNKDVVTVSKRRDNGGNNALVDNAASNGEVEQLKDIPCGSLLSKHLEQLPHLEPLCRKQLRNT